jgi:DNA-directed RNA polymerase subunit RPC12/RpoP
MLRSYSQAKAQAQAQCPTCHHERELYPAHPAPVKTHLLFGVSFLAFMWFSSQPSAKENPRYLWAWTGVQVLLGVVLLYMRKRAQKKVYRCLRCDSAPIASDSPPKP